MKNHNNLSQSSDQNQDEIELQFLSIKSQSKQQDQSFQILKFDQNQNQSLSLSQIISQQSIPCSQNYLSQQIWSTQHATSIIRSTIKQTVSNFKTLKTNITYNLKHNQYLDIFSKRQKLTLSPLHGISLLGNIYKTSRQKEQFYMYFNSIIWLTYRSGIYGVQSDAGWGCMIRVCQMVIAESIKRITQKNKKINQIIEYFKDTPQAYFSLTRICARGNIAQRWTSSIEIFTILRKLTLQLTQFVLKIDIYSVSLQIESLSKLQQLQYPRLIFVSNRLGKNRIQNQFQQHLLQIMNISQFVGMVGGNGGEALYIIGHDYQGKVLFLDPHYVHKNQNEIDKSQAVSTYFPNQPYLIDIQALAPSIAMNFIVKSKQEYLVLLNRLFQLQQFYRGGLCIEIQCKQLQQRNKKQKTKQKQ